MKNKLNDFILAKGYDCAYYLCDWGTFDVYKPIFLSNIGVNVAPKDLIIINKNSIKWANKAEIEIILNEIYDGDNRIFKNSPIQLEQGVTIKSFKLERGGYFGNYLVFKYRTKKNIKNLSFSDDCKNDLPEFESEDIIIKDEDFDKNIIELVKYFNKDFGVNPLVCDGEWFEFRATLSNGQKLKSSGYNYFPYTYYELILYLEHYLHKFGESIHN